MRLARLGSIYSLLSTHLGFFQRLLRVRELRLVRHEAYETVDTSRKGPPHHADAQQETSFARHCHSRPTTPVRGVCAFACAAPQMQASGESS